MEISVLRSSNLPAQSARNLCTSSRNTRHAGSAAVNRWLLLSSATRRESGYQRGELLGGAQRLPVIVTRVQNQRRARHLACLVAHIDTAELLQEPHGVLR